MNQIALPLILVIAFVAVATLVQAMLGGFFAAQAKRKRVNRRMSLLESGISHKQVYETLIRKQISTPDFKNASVLNVYKRAVRFLAQAGLHVSPLILIAIWIAISFGIWVAATTILRAFGNPVTPSETGMSLFGALALVGNAMWIWIVSRRRKRTRILEEQLPLALDIVIRSLRAGHPVVSALQLVTTEMGDPIGTEFGLIVDETNYGFELKEALANFARRTGSEDVHFFAVSVSIQTETGGNLAEIIDNLARVIRARITLGKRVKALASEGRMSGWILSGLPVFLVSFLSLSQPSFYVSKFNDPIFWPTVLAVIGLYFAGLMLMHRITNFRY